MTDSSSVSGKLPVETAHTYDANFFTYLEGLNKILARGGEKNSIDFLDILNKNPNQVLMPESLIWEIFHKKTGRDLENKQILEMFKKLSKNERLQIYRPIEENNEITKKLYKYNNKKGWSPKEDHEILLDMYYRISTPFKTGQSKADLDSHEMFAFALDEAQHAGRDLRIISHTDDKASGEPFVPSRRAPNDPNNGAEFIKKGEQRKFEKMKEVFLSSEKLNRTYNTPDVRRIETMTTADTLHDWGVNGQITDQQRAAVRDNYRQDGWAARPETRETVPGLKLYGEGPRSFRSRLIPLGLIGGGAAAAGVAAAGSAEAAPLPQPMEEAGIDVRVERQGAGEQPASAQRGFFGRLWDDYKAGVTNLALHPRETLHAIGAAAAELGDSALDVGATILKPVQNLIEHPAENAQALVDELYDQGKYVVNNPLQALRNTGAAVVNTVAMVGDVAGLATGAVNAAGRYAFDPNVGWREALSEFTPDKNWFMRNTEAFRDGVREVIGADKPESVTAQITETIIQTIATLGLGAVAKGASGVAKVGVNILTQGAASTGVREQLMQGGLNVGMTGAGATLSAPESPPAAPNVAAPGPTGTDPLVEGPEPGIEMPVTVTGPSAGLKSVSHHETDWELQSLRILVNALDARFAALENSFVALQSQLPAQIQRIAEELAAERRENMDYSQMRSSLPSGRMRHVYNSLEPHGAF